MTVAPDVAAVLAAKTARTYCYGFLGILLPVYLAELGVGATGIGAAVTITLAGSAALTWGVRRPAERWGGRAALLGLAGLSAVAAALLLASAHPAAVVAAAVLGNVAVGTGETGPFLAIEQVVIARAARAPDRTTLLAVYNLAGYAAAAGGAATVGLRPGSRALFAIFLAGAVFQLLAYARLSPTPAAPRPAPGVAMPSAPLIRRLAALFALDAFAGGFVLQSLVAFYLHRRWGLELATLGAVFAAAQVLTAASLLLAVPLARRYGLLPTMVVSHLASNVALIAVAAAPSAAAAVGFLLGRQLLSQMDVPTRQAYLMAAVEDHEREAAAVSTTLARTVAQAVSPALTGWVTQAVALGAPFVLGGGLKIVYDLLLWATCRRVTLRGDADRGGSARPPA